MHHKALSLLLLISAAASGQELLSQCAHIDDDTERLRCYDAVSGRVQKTPPPDIATEPEFGSRWEQQLLADATRAPFSLQSDQPTYVLATRLSSFNYGPYHEFDPDDQLSRSEAKLNLSLKTKAIDNLFRSNGDLWLAYTQTSYWQVFNVEFSSPFRQTDHNPEARLAFLTDYPLPGMTLRGVEFGLRHDSNGQAGSLTRSWNRLFADFKFVRGNLVLGIRPWVRVFNVDENPDIEDYYGHVELRASWEKRNQLFSATVRNAFDHRYGLQLNWSFPISGRLRGLVQWHYGYSENLIDYDHKNNRIGVGVLLSDWL